MFNVASVDVTRELTGREHRTDGSLRNGIHRATWETSNAFDPRAKCCRDSEMS